MTNYEASNKNKNAKGVYNRNTNDLLSNKARSSRTQLLWMDSKRILILVRRFVPMNAITEKFEGSSLIRLNCWLTLSSFN